MRVPVNWLKSYIDFQYSPQELADKLTMLGLEVEGIEYMGEGLEGIIVGEIKKVKPHPNADKLVICEVDTGQELLQIITGAPNVKEGIKVPVAPVGVTLPGGLKIKKARLRGENSYGMICSIDELGLSEKRASGIMILDEDAEVGTDIIDYLHLDEYVLKLDLTPNYARCLGLLGIAREIKSVLGNEIKKPDTDLVESESESIENYISIEVEDKDLCPRYTGRVIKNIKIGPSPRWMQARLRAAGIRPINNIVDITNYVMLEYNQPLHAFDYDKIDKKIIVRRGKEQEKLITLDNKERELDEEVLVIADTEKALGLAGVMGGANSEVCDDTTTVFLESAYFNPVNIRKTAKKFALPSEASHRFEREVDIEGVIAASNRAAYLMQKYAGGEIVRGIVDVYPEPRRLHAINLDTGYVNKILGLNLDKTEIEDMLTRLEFKVEERDSKSLKVMVPSFRSDIEREADLIEEVARMYGYNNIPVTRPESKQRGRKTYKQHLEDITRNYMSAMGLDEVITFSLTGKKVYDDLDIPEDSSLRNWVKVKNPLNEALSILRTSLLPSIIEVLSNNAKRQVETMSVYELGKIFTRIKEKKRPEERVVLAGGCMGKTDDPWKTGAPDFFYLKGVVVDYLRELGLDGLDFTPSKLPFLHPGRTAEIYYRDTRIGIMGELMPDIADRFNLRSGTAVFQLDFETIVEEADLDRQYEQLPRYPAVERDMAVVVENEVFAGSLLKLIRENGGKLLKKAGLFDLYQGKQIPEGYKSLAFKLVFQAHDRTLTDDEVNEVFNSIMDQLKDKFGAEIRGV
ncbi:phenylalanine--tRNA ligase subunit beta [Halothermothrix orenii]|uniref:Phenylalanine--tRNA ligase beta subunit n=1 Tax=Halothermothrix orenii (strain H 168 / OCM 544 / DSM 9562) TaxID=373903 RepID=B8D294_HALOH|nr:phenylalanine--tRNA ligase subunit beta [Halothermothrix orenii]ACL69321.1 phenylalanyl-tRNA synthetase, beta subunit [Halothermothrix orenii H 168]